MREPTIDLMVECKSPADTLKISTISFGISVITSGFGPEKRRPTRLGRTKNNEYMIIEKIYNQLYKILSDDSFVYGWYDIKRGIKRNDFESNEYILGSPQILEKQKVGTCWEITMWCIEKYNADYIFLFDKERDITHTIAILKENGYYIPIDPLRFGVREALNRKSKSFLGLAKNLSKEMNCDLYIPNLFPKTGTPADICVEEFFIK